MVTFIGRHPLLTYFALAFTGFWGCIALAVIDGFWAPILGALAPGVSALFVLGVTEGEVGVRALLRRLGQWRTAPVWYLAVLGLPIAQGLLAIGLATLGGSFTPDRMGRLMPAMWVVFVFAAVEELGWRGYALPRLLGPRTALSASLILGALHASWHWPLILLPGQFLSGTPLVPYSTWVLSEATLLTWIFRNTRGSVLMTTLYHGTSNLSGVLFAGIDRAWIPWVRPSISVLTALTVVFVTGPDLVWKRDSARTG